MGNKNLFSDMSILIHLTENKKKQKVLTTHYNAVYYFYNINYIF